MATTQNIEWEFTYCIHVLFSATCGNVQCPSNGFLAHDCTCYCPVDSTDKSVPVIQCGGSGSGGGTTSCQALDTPCSCGSSTTSCSTIENSQCNSGTGACECEGQFAKYNGACVDPSSKYRVDRPF